MSRFITSFVAGLLAIVAGYCVSSAADLPGALSREGPALTNFNNVTVLAWAGIEGTEAHKVRYATFKGNSTTEHEIPGALTLSAPALASGAQSVYLAITPPDADNSIDLYASNDGGTFSSMGPLCDANACARTLAAPALAGAGATLYAAWSTPNGAIKYATYINGVWGIAPLPIPNARTDARNGPALALYQDRLYVAWLAPNGQTVSVASATLPLSNGSWSGQAIQIPAQSHVAPALGVLTVPGAPNSAAQSSQALFVAWTAPDSRVNFARWNPQVAQWAASPSPIPLPTGPLTSLTVALNGFTFEENQECFYVNSLADVGVGPGHRHKIDFRKVTGGCP
jgi:hypothetical protein